MAKRARLDYVQFDVECIDKPRFQTFLDSVDPIAGLFLIQLWLKIGRAENARIPRKYAASLCHSVRCPKDIAEKAIELAIEEELLGLDGEFLTLSRIEKEQEKVAKQREEWRKKKGYPEEETPDVPDSFPEDSPGNPQGKKCDSPEILNTEHLTLNTEVLDLKKTVSPPERPPDDADEYLKLAYEKLEPPQSQPWTQKPWFVNAGRRPMKDYPNLHWTPFGLATVLRDWVESGIPGERFQHGFLLAEAKARAAVERGRPPPDAESWCLSFIKSELMQNVTQELRMNTAKERKYATTNR